MSSAAAVAASSAAISAANTARRKAECVAGMDDFQHVTATVVQRQHYADCVRLIHPDPLSGTEAIALKVAIVVVLISAAVGSFMNFRRYEPIESSLFGFFAGGIGSIVLGGTGFAIFAGLRYVVS